MSDTLRERCIEAGRDAMGRSSSWRWWAPRHLEKLFDLWEPMIRGHADATHICTDAIERARADERAKVMDDIAKLVRIIEEPNNHEEALEAALREERLRSTSLRAELDRAQEQGDDLADIIARVETLPHVDWKDPNGRPRPCPMEWPGGPCQCYRARVLAMIRGDDNV